MQKETKRMEVPSVFVGKFGYPHISVGFLHTEKDQKHDDPLFWSKHNYSIASVTKLRKNLVNAPFQSSVTEKLDKRLELAKMLVMAKKPASVELTFTQKTTTSLKNQGEAIPYGPSTLLHTIQSPENIQTDVRLEKLFFDTDASATTAIHELYKKGVDEHAISKLLSVGGLGRGSLRKLVPTRWSITATDDTLSQSLKETLIGYDTHPYCAFTSDYLGNYFLILLFEGPFAFHFLEVLPDKSIKEDVELALGRKEYAKQTTGGYYAAKVAVLEYLAKEKKVASVFCIRFITDEYYLSLGVWVVREAVKKTLLQNPLEFSDATLLAKYATLFCQKKQNVSLETYIQQSPVLRFVLKQKNLFDF